MCSSSVLGSSERIGEVTDSEIELSALALDWISENTPITSKGDLLDHMYSPAFCDSPLQALSREGLEVFVDSLVFTEYGLASWRYDMLVEELSERQIYEVMQLFGRQFHNPLVEKRLLTPDELIIRKATAPLYIGSRGILQDHACAGIRCAYLEFSTCDRSWCESWAPPPIPIPPFPWPPTFPTFDPSKVTASCL